MTSDEGDDAPSVTSGGVGEPRGAADEDEPEESVEYRGTAKVKIEFCFGITI